MSNILKSLSLFYQNVRGLNTKINQAKLFVNVNCYDVIGLTETWLGDGVNSSEIFNKDYHVFRHDRVTHAPCWQLEPDSDVFVFQNSNQILLKMFGSRFALMILGCIYAVCIFLLITLNRLL